MELAFAWHVVQRFGLHVLASNALVTWTFFGVRMARLKWPKFARYTPSNMRVQLVMCAILVALGAFSREAYDVSQGGLLIKSVFDMISWIVGPAAAVYTSIKKINLEFGDKE